jgi:YidC/Oxa1 family membrane protein insertase
LAAEGGAATLPGAPAVAGPMFKVAAAPATSITLLDGIYQQPLAGWSYVLDYVPYVSVGVLVKLFAFAGVNWAPILALIALALIVKLATFPLTTASFRGMRDMQRVQPLVKALQEKYADDREKLAREQMKLMKEHNVSMTGGCLPMIVQIPIFYLIYHAVQVYSAHFDVPFLWVSSLAVPDMILLILYLVSMVITQYLTATPSADPQQKAMQAQMTFMMPVVLALVLTNVASAFILYWFVLNVLSSAHQYYLKQKFAREEQAPADAASASGKKGK